MAENLTTKLKWALEELTSLYEDAANNGGPGAVAFVTGLLGLLAVVAVYLILKINWAWAFTTWWVCSELTSIRMTLQSDAERRAKFYGEKGNR